MDNKFFVHRIKRTNGTVEKGIEVKDTYDDAKQSYHAYLGAYAYAHEKNTDFASCMITDMSGMVLLSETWRVPPKEEEKKMDEDEKTKEEEKMIDEDEKTKEEEKMIDEDEKTKEEEKMIDEDEKTKSGLLTEDD